MSGMGHRGKKAPSSDTDQIGKTTSVPMGLRKRQKADLSTEEIVGSGSGAAIQSTALESKNEDIDVEMMNDKGAPLDALLILGAKKMVFADTGKLVNSQDLLGREILPSYSALTGKPLSKKDPAVPLLTTYAAFKQKILKENALRKTIDGGFILTFTKNKTKAQNKTALHFRLRYKGVHTEGAFDIEKGYNRAEAEAGLKTLFNRLLSQALFIKKPDGELATIGEVLSLRAFRKAANTLSEEEGLGFRLTTHNIISKWNITKEEILGKLKTPESRASVPLGAKTREASLASIPFQAFVPTLSMLVTPPLNIGENQYFLRRNAGGGNCFFLAIGLIIHADSKILRREACDYLEAHPELFVRHPLPVGMEIDIFIERMRKDGAFAEGALIEAMAFKSNVKLAIFIKDDHGIINKVPQVINPEGTIQVDLLLSGNHYELLVPVPSMRSASVAMAK
jgi:hypothetical protein